MLTKKNILNLIIIPIITIAVSILLGIFLNNSVWGIISLSAGFLNAYYMAIGKWYNYIFGIIFSVTYSANCYFAGLFGFVIFTIIVYTPMQIYGLINWKKNKQNDEVLMKSLNIKKASLLCGLIVLGSAGLGFLLALIPGQNLSFLDSTSQLTNIAGLFLMMIRYRESWYIWLIQNSIDLTIWIINLINGVKDSLMVLIVSVMYLIMNVIGVISWIKIERKQKQILQN